MRNISPLSLQKLAQQYGNEPVCILKIKWSDNGNYYFYCDKEISQDILNNTKDSNGNIINLIPNILEISNLESVVKISKSGRSQSVSVKLSDVPQRITDETNHLKEIINYNDIHKRKITVFQWFSDIPLSEAFVLFQGEISSPIVWTEGERTLSFDIIETIEDREVGFSPEEGQFDVIPKDQIGKSWPLVFGTVINVPVRRLNDPPIGTTLDPIGFYDPSLILQMGKNAKIAEEYYEIAYLDLLFAGQAAFTAFELRSEGKFDEAKQYEGIQKQWEDAAAQLLQQRSQIIADNMNLGLELASQLSIGLTTRIILSDRYVPFPMNETVTVSLNGQAVDGIFTRDSSGTIFTGTGVNVNFDVKPSEGNTISPVVNGLPNPNVRLNVIDNPISLSVNINDKIDKGSALIIQPGASIKLISTYPIYYICNIIPSIILSVNARRSSENTKGLFTVPSNFYEIQQMQFGNEINPSVLDCTILIFPRALSTYNLGWEDDIFVTLGSSIGPNIIDILKYLIDNYTTYTYDLRSFDYVRTKLIGYPANFPLLERKNILTILEEIAYQSKCSIWLESGNEQLLNVSNSIDNGNLPVFKIKYLPEDVVEDDTITENDIEFGSIVVNHTSTEELVTKYNLTWRYDYSLSEPNRIIYRSNINKYGLIEKQYDYYIYNNITFVEKVATFWLIRESNTWKHIIFNTFLNKINLETNDTVKLNFEKDYVVKLGNSLSSNPNIGSIKGIVDSVQYNSSNQSISFDIWLPVRLGEMDIFPFALPENLSITELYPPEDVLIYSGGTAPITPPKITGQWIVQVEQNFNSLMFEPSDFGYPIPQYISPDDIIRKRNEVKAREITNAAIRENDQRALSGDIQNNRQVVPQYYQGQKIYVGDGLIHEITNITRDTENPNTVHIDMYPPVSPDIGPYFPITPIENNDFAPDGEVSTGDPYKDYPIPAQPAGTPEDDKGNSFPGRIISGSGDTYQAEIYPNGLANSSENVTVKQLDISSLEVIPEGTWIIVVKNEGTYVMQHPIYE